MFHTHFYTAVAYPQNMTSMRIVAIMVAAALVSGTVLASPGMAYAATLTTAKVFTTDDNVSATSTTYIFAFKTASSGSIKRVEITAPAGYGVAGATLTGSSLALQLGTLTVSGQTMRLTLPLAIPLSSGNQLSVQISGIDNPALVGPHTFDFATKNNAGGTIDSGNAAITLTDSGVAPGSIGTDQIQDGAITLDKLAADVLSYITGLLDSLEAQLIAMINAEAAARMAADTTLQSNIDSEAAARAAADANLQDQIDALDARVSELEGENVVVESIEVSAVDNQGTPFEPFLEYTATAFYSDGSTEDVTNLAIWEVLGSALESEGGGSFFCVEDTTSAGISIQAIYEGSTDTELAFCEI